MNLVQLTGRLVRLTRELSAAEVAASRHSVNSSRLTGERAPSLCGPGPDGGAFRSTIPGMVKPPSTHDWIGSFAGRLIQLRPSMKVSTAVQYAVMSIHHAADLDPYRAAELLLLSIPANERVGAHGAAQAPERQASRYQEMFDARAAEPLPAAT